MAMRHLVAMAMAIAAAAAGLTACSHGDSGNNSSGGAAAGGQTEATPPANTTDDPQNGVEPVRILTSAPVSAVPAAFRGRWAAVSGDCNNAGPGLLVVSASGLSLGGAALAVRSLSVAGPYHLAIVTAASPGHPATTERLSLVEDGRTLIRQQQAPAGAVNYLRCPA